MQLQTILIGALAAVALVVGVFLMMGVPPSSQVVQGDTVALGQGAAYAWERWTGGRLEAVGITFDEAVLVGLPDENIAFTLALPRRSFSTPFKHVMFDWNYQGHEPVGVYDVPHFDVHFYTISTEERHGIVAGPDPVAVQPDHVPSGYFSTVDAVPDMGVHWIAQDAGELNGEAFDKTLIYGYYRGKLVFFEPMITKAFFESQPDFSAPIPQPKAFQLHGKSYPTQYVVKYDRGKKQYTVALEGMVPR